MESNKNKIKEILKGTTKKKINLEKKKGNESSDGEESNDKERSDKESDDKKSDKESSDKESDDKKSDKESNDKESDKESSDKESDKESSDKESDSKSDDEESNEDTPKKIDKKEKGDDKENYFTTTEMRELLNQMISSGIFLLKIGKNGGNQNKTYGIYYEIIAKKYLEKLGVEYFDGPWIIRSTDENFGEKINILFPTSKSYNNMKEIKQDDSFIKKINEFSLKLKEFSVYVCYPVICNEKEVNTKMSGKDLRELCKEKGLSSSDNKDKLIERLNLKQNSIIWLFQKTDSDEFLKLDDIMDDFKEAGSSRNQYNHKSKMEWIEDENEIQRIFWKEHLRIFINKYKKEIVDIDSLIYYKKEFFLMEIKSKTKAKYGSIGDYFGLDICPYVKMNFFKTFGIETYFFVIETEYTDDEKEERSEENERKGEENKKKEIKKKSNEEPFDEKEKVNKKANKSKIKDQEFQKRDIISYLVINCDKINKYSAWLQISGGTSMGGGTSSLIKIPKNKFKNVKKIFN